MKSFVVNYDAIAGCVTQRVHRLHCQNCSSLFAAASSAVHRPHSMLWRKRVFTDDISRSSMKPNLNLESPAQSYFGGFCWDIVSQSLDAAANWDIVTRLLDECAMRLHVSFNSGYPSSEISSPLFKGCHMVCQAARLCAR